MVSCVPSKTQLHLANIFLPSSNVCWGEASTVVTSWCAILVSLVVLKLVDSALLMTPQVRAIDD
jgi:hypothetical protein